MIVDRLLQPSTKREEVDEVGEVLFVLETLTKRQESVTPAKQIDVGRKFFSSSFSVFAKAARQS